MPEEELGVEETTQETTDTGDAEQPPADSPAVDWDSEDNPYRQRYESLRPQYDTFQNIVNQIANPETRAQALQQFGIELLDGEQDDDDFDADEPLTRAEFEDYLTRIEQAQLAQTAEERALDSDATAISAQLDVIEAEHGKLSEEELSILLPLALQNRDESGAPRFRDAFDQFATVSQNRHKAYLESKRAAKVQAGTAGTEQVNLADDDARQQLMAEVMAATQEAEGA